MEKSFRDIMNMPASERVEFPKVPPGQYVAFIKATSEEETQKEVPFLRVQVELVEAWDVDDKEALEEYGDLAGKVINYDLFPTYEFGMNRLQELIDNCDLSKGSKDDAMKEMVGKTIIVSIKHDTYPKGSGTIQERIDGMAKYE